MSGVVGPTDTPIVRALEEVVGHGDQVVSVAPVRLEAPGRALPLEVRISAPISGDRLPVLLFAHGNGWSLDGYAPLTAFWASRGFVVVQATHLDSRRNGVGFDDPRYAGIWIERNRDLRRVRDQLGALVQAVPGLAGRVDADRIAIARHSWGGQTVQMLLGARIARPDGALGEEYRDPRVTAGVLLAATGLGGEELQPFARAALPFMDASFDDLTAPTLIVAGDKDQSRLSSRGPDWFTDAYTHSPGATDLLTLEGAEHSLGGIPSWEAAASPPRLASRDRSAGPTFRSGSEAVTLVRWRRRTPVRRSPGRSDWRRLATRCGSSCGCCTSGSAPCWPPRPS